ncbi:hypothetical protein ES703_79655 [subsurface metagenome]
MTEEILGNSRFDRKVVTFGKGVFIRGTLSPRPPEVCSGMSASSPGIGKGPEVLTPGPLAVYALMATASGVHSALVETSLTFVL